MKTCFNILENFPDTHGNIFKNLKRKISEAGYDNIINAETRIEAFRELSDANRKINLKEEDGIFTKLLELYPNSPILNEPKLNAAKLYQQSFSLQSARFLSLLRTNSLYKPFQFMGMANTCVMCKNAKHKQNNDLEKFASMHDIFKHVLFDCPHAPKAARALRKNCTSWETIELKLTHPTNDEITLKVIETARIMRYKLVEQFYPKDASMRGR